MVVYIANIAIAIEHNRYDTESKIRDGMSEAIKQIDFPYETVSGVDVLSVQKLKKEDKTAEILQDILGSMKILLEKQLEDEQTRKD